MKLIVGSLFILILLNACGGNQGSPGSSSTLPGTSSIRVVSQTPVAECQGKAPGVDFACADGCNTCSCDASGHLASTMLACQAP